MDVDQRPGSTSAKDAGAKEAGATDQALPSEGAMNQSSCPCPTTSQEAIVISSESESEPNDFGLAVREASRRKDSKEERATNKAKRTGFCDLRTPSDGKSEAGDKRKGSSAGSQATKKHRSHHSHHSRHSHHRRHRHSSRHSSKRPTTTSIGKSNTSDQTSNNRTNPSVSGSKPEAGLPYHLAKRDQKDDASSLSKKRKAIQASEAVTPDKRALNPFSRLNQAQTSDRRHDNALKSMIKHTPYLSKSAQGARQRALDSKGQGSHSSPTHETTPKDAQLRKSGESELTIDQAADLFNFFKSQQPPKPTTTLASHIPAANNPQRSILAGVSSNGSSSNNKEPCPESGPDPPSREDRMLEDTLPHSSPSALEAASKPPDTQKPETFVRPPQRTLIHPSLLPLPPSVSRKPRQKQTSPPPTPNRVPSIPATTAFDPTQPIRTYTIYKTEQQIQAPTLGQNTQYTTIREIRMRSFVALGEANKYAEEAMARNDGRVRSIVRAKQWDAVERGPGEGNTFRGETTFANGSRYVFEVREGWEHLADVARVVTTRRGRDAPLPELLVDAEKSKAYAFRYDVFSLTVYPSGGASEPSEPLGQTTRAQTAPQATDGAVVSGSTHKHEGGDNLGSKPDINVGHCEFELYSDDDADDADDEEDKDGEAYAGGDGSEGDLGIGDVDNQDGKSGAGYDGDQDGDDEDENIPTSQPVITSHGPMQDISCVSKLHGSYTCFKLANRAALETFLQLAKPENSRIADNMLYQNEVRPEYIGLYDRDVRGARKGDGDVGNGEGLVEIEWQAPPSPPYQWRFIMVRVWVVETRLRGPVDLGGMVVDRDRALLISKDGGEVPKEKEAAKTGGRELKDVDETMSEED